MKTIDWSFCSVSTLFFLFRSASGQAKDSEHASVDEDDDDDEDWIIPVAVVLSIVGVTLLVIIIVCLCLRQSRRKKQHQQQQQQVVAMAPYASSSSSSQVPSSNATAPPPPESDVIRPSMSTSLHPTGHASMNHPIAPPPYEASYPSNPSYYDNVHRGYSPHPMVPPNAPSAPDKGRNGL